MPCNTIQTSKVEWVAEKTNIDLLQMALEQLGYQVSVRGKELTFSGTGYNYVRGTYKDGKFDVSFDARKKFDENTIKVAYSKQVVKKTAKRFGWTLTETDENEYEAVKRF